MLRLRVAPEGNISINLAGFAFIENMSGRSPLQRLFSTFPSGRPGIGLLLLRLVLGGLAATLGVLELAVEHSILVWVVAAILVVSGAGLIVGFMTPLASVLVGLCILGMALSWIPTPPLASMGVTLVALLMVVTAIGLALLGPGAFSVDGQLFGRREIVIPPRSPER
jgi:uncharacterized membrane protein YphA (DoxX/SURF4 family)